jgi:hypothetical protein
MLTNLSLLYYSKLGTVLLKLAFCGDTTFCKEKILHFNKRLFFDYNISRLYDQ